MDMGIKRKKLWTVLALILAGLTVFAVFSQSGDMSFDVFIEKLRSAKPGWLILALFGMVGIIFFEGESIVVILRSAGYPRSHRKGFLYSAADIYFSAITPSASGGQPASAFFMIKDGIPGAVVSAALVVNLVMYTLAVVSIALVCLIVSPGIFWRFSIPSRILIVAGFLALSGLAVLFVLLLVRADFLFGTARKFVVFLSGHHLVRHPEKLKEKLHHAEEEYAACVTLMAGRPHMMAASYIYDVLQRLSQFLVILAVYMAFGGSASRLGELFVTQCFIILGSNCVPVPGGMGITDYLMLDGYGQMFDRAFSFQLEIMGRSLSFYCSTLLSAIVVLAGYFLLKKRERRIS